MMSFTGDCCAVPRQTESALSLPLPSRFLDFLQDNGLDPSIYVCSDSVPRYIRIKPGFESSLSDVETELNCKLKKVDWLPGVFAIPPHIQIASSNAYRQAKIYGMDAASGAAVVALDVSPGHHVLDLCAAPGAKLCMLADMLGKSGSLTGVDVSRHRLAACRTMLLKYALGDHCRLFVADGTSFYLLPLRTHSEPSFCTGTTDGANDITRSDDLLKEWSSKRPWKERKKANKKRSEETVSRASEPELLFYGRSSGLSGLHRSMLFQMPLDSDILEYGYDRVLVDAECTHDGSIRHIQKFEHWGWDTLQHRVLDAQRTDNLFCLQLQLLTNGFRLLKTGGFLIYSTCSLTVAQNETVVEMFLSKTPQAELQDISAAKIWPCKSGKIPRTLRFDPSTSQTSGLFIAKIVKLASR